MPVFKDHQIHSNTKLGVWHCTESIQQLLEIANLDKEDQIKCASFKNDQRQKHFIAVRILCEILIGPSKILYREGGKPSLLDDGQHISISHSHDYVAVLISSSPQIGIDIQQIEDKILRIRNRFVNDDDKLIIDFHNTEDLTLLWCVKESLYKINGDPTVFFNEHMRIDKLTSKLDSRIEASINHDLYHGKHQFKFEILENYVLVYTVFE